MINNYSPIVLFAYNRPDHLTRTVNALLNNSLADKSELIIYSDAPKYPEASKNVEEVRKYIRFIKGFKNINIIEREKNYGLANSIIDGVTTCINNYGRVIVLEDDLVTSPYFLTYMNEGLNLYENDHKVASIHSFMYSTKIKLPDYFFIRGADCLGWATWKRAWDLFNPDSNFLLNEIKKKKFDRQFNFNNSYNYTGMLQSQIDGKISSWAIRWYASTFLADKYTLYPKNSFVDHIGWDGSGTNCFGYGNFNTKFSETYNSVPLLPVIDSQIGRKAIIKYFLSLKSNIFKKIKKVIKLIFKYN